MAWMIDQAVICGEIDNTVEGKTTGRIWMAERDEPLILRLDGDCWRDLAGTCLRFENPSPRNTEDARALDTDQSGIIGDMTASRKNKYPAVSDEKLQQLHQDDADIPYSWKNTLYLEWFSGINGRIVIETSTFALEITERQWEMDEDAEQAQKLANLNAMRDFMAQVIQRRDPAAKDSFLTGELDEFAWEERLKESDRLTDAYQEVLEKYMEDSDSERKEAFVMGWDSLLDSLAEREEAGDENYPGADPAYGSPVDPSFNLDDYEEDCFLKPDDDLTDSKNNHPLQEQSQELALRAMDVVSQDAGPGSPSYLLVSNLLQVSAKLAGALNERDSGYEPEPGFVLAVLKRCLNWLNEAVGACQKLMAEEKDQDQLAALNHLRTSTFEIRASIVEIRRQLK